MDLPPEFRQIVASMFEDNNKSCPSCADLITKAQKWSSRARAGSIGNASSRTPIKISRDIRPDSLLFVGETRLPLGNPNGPISPEVMISALPALHPPPSRYRQDWEELEFLVSFIVLVMTYTDGRYLGKRGIWKRSESSLEA